jgi:hypothetical protein
MLKVVGVVLLSIAGAALAAGIVLARSGPSTVALESDLSTVRAEIAAADREAATMGGLLAVEANLRVQVLRSTEAMLDQKRMSLLRGITLAYRDDRPGARLLPDEAARIEKEVTAANADLSDAQSEAARYSGGLILSMLLVRGETDKVTLATLKQQQALARYGIPIPSLAPGRPGAVEAHRTPGTIVPDREALQ